MKGSDFPGSQFDLVKPNDMTDEQCGSLPAARGVDASGFPFILTAFKPSKEDLEALNRGELVYLKVLGQQFAPVSLFTLDGIGEVNPQ